MRRYGLTLIELLAVVGILAVLVGILLPTIHKVRKVAYRLNDQNNLRQLGIAVNHYAEEFTYLPPAKTRENGKDRWWFAESTPGGKTIDYRRGHLMPYLDYNHRALQVPAKVPGPVYLRYDGLTGGHGYNYRYLAPFEEKADGTLVWTRILIARVASTSRTIAFCNAVGTTTESVPTGNSPSLIEVPLSEPPSAQVPSVHFRQAGGVCNVLFVDGHVEGWIERTRNPPPPGDPASILMLREDENVFDIGSTDELWDLR
jgi:prepilin-type processing-associated H-X9-DG protein/prepilin-type N-terminal cleavage/methylation domain-containing protein